MKIHSLALLALAAALAIAPAARADSFDFTFTDAGGVSGSGTLFGTFEGPGVWLLTSGSGTFDDGTTGLLPIDLVANPNGPDNSSLSTSGLFAYDDLLTPWVRPPRCSPSMDWISPSTVRNSTSIRLAADPAPTDGLKTT